jgi:hypothetical protein
MCWPATGDRLDALEHGLRYGPSIDGFDMEDRLLAAAVIAAYQDLIWTEKFKRNQVIRELRRHDV